MSIGSSESRHHASSRALSAGRRKLVLIASRVTAGLMAFLWTSVLPVCRKMASMMLLSITQRMAHEQLWCHGAASKWRRYHESFEGNAPGASLRERWKKIFEVDAKLLVQIVADRPDCDVIDTEIEKFLDAANAMIDWTASGPDLDAGPS